MLEDSLSSFLEITEDFAIFASNRLSALLDRYLDNSMHRKSEHISTEVFFICSSIFFEAKTLFYSQEATLQFFLLLTGQTEQNRPNFQQLTSSAL